jgi:hypothetical protein
MAPKAKKPPPGPSANQPEAGNAAGPSNAANATAPAQPTARTITTSAGPSQAGNQTNQIPNQTNRATINPPSAAGDAPNAPAAPNQPTQPTQNVIDVPMAELSIADLDDTNIDPNVEAFLAHLSQEDDAPTQPTQNQNQNQVDIRQAYADQRQAYTNLLVQPQMGGDDLTPEEQTMLEAHDVAHADTGGMDDSDDEATPAPQGATTSKPDTSGSSKLNQGAKKLLAMLSQLVYHSVRRASREASASPAPAPNPIPSRAPAQRANAAPINTNQNHVAAAANPDARHEKECFKLLRNVREFDGTDNQEDSENWLYQFEAVLKSAINQGVPGLTLIHLLSTRLRGPALTWFKQLFEGNEQWDDPQTFISSFRLRFCREVMYKPQNAREKLMNGKVNQRPNQDVQSYHQYFRRITDQAVDMAEADKIAWFLQGMRPDLRTMCAVDAVGKPWQSLKPLFEYAIGAELRLKHANTNHRRSAHPHPQANASQSNQNRGNQNRGDRGNQDRKRANGGDQSGPSPDTKRVNREYNTAWGPLDAPNDKWPHLTNAEVHRRFNNNICCFCGEHGHKAKDCKSTAKKDNSKRK